MAAGKLILAARATGGAVARRRVYVKQSKSKLSKLARVVRSIMPELKHYSEAAVTSGGLTTASIIIPLLNGIVVGTGETTRTGNEITLKQIQLMCYISQGATTPASVRVMLVLDKQNIGTNPVIGDIIDTSGGGSTNQVMGVRNFYNMKRFTFLYDKATVFTTNIHSAARFKITRRLNKKIEYSSATAAVKNQLYLVAVTDAAATQPTLLVDNSLKFIDN